MWNVHPLDEKLARMPVSSSCPNEIVEIQAQHWPDRLHKPRTGSVWTDQLGPDRCVNWEVIGQIFREGIYFGIRVGAHL